MSESNSKIIGEATPVRIGLVIVFLGVFGSGVWWASSVNSKLDSIMSNQSSVSTSIAEEKAAQVTTSKEVGDITLRVAILESKLDTPKK